MTPRSRTTGGFTLIELLIAFAILTFLVVLLASLVSAVHSAWTRGEQQVSEFQDGRAILELVGRELSQAVISPALQFVHDPNLGGTPQRAHSDCIFWQGPGSSTSAGNLAEIGYYLSDNYELKRFYVPPTDGTNYQIFTPANQPTDVAAPWLTNFVTNQSLSTTVTGGVLAFWARCLDVNGDPIPWLASAPPRFNSAASFRPAIPGQPNSFQYTNANTARANLLPSFVEIVVVTLDSQTFRRNPNIPDLPTQNSPNDLPGVRDSFNQQLITNKVQNARTFATRVRLLNGP